MVKYLGPSGKVLNGKALMHGQNVSLSKDAATQLAGLGWEFYADDGQPLWSQTFASNLDQDNPAIAAVAAADPAAVKADKK